MDIEFRNDWHGCSMKDGRCFPINIFDIYADIHPSFKYISFGLLNFSMVIQFKHKKEE